ncbi:hypothetical protein [Verminephrobacter eiseniae]|uniref:hypothetical protein n=1 Tax=Verminephrobacter eiseniae TaxID=364317 RepID=UPI0022381FFD|nr:hypothetical protein [Verminephrobacter eiseniae]
MSRHRSSVGLRWPSKRIAALHRLPIRSVWAARCALRCAPMAARSLRHLIRDATLGAPEQARNAPSGKWLHTMKSMRFVRVRARRTPPRHLQASCRCREDLQRRPGANRRAGYPVPRHNGQHNENCASARTEATIHGFDWPSPVGQRRMSQTGNPRHTKPSGPIFPETLCGHHLENMSE